ncbi:MAG: trigger factor, partial [Dysgonamonadaceae bacterium]|nr:trigger factor [Dysgonamonadaceae bacterium]MDD3310375.1 trigger factor [Dysgonamonadaceae bacterium]MDD4399737.1 trigger factor [Dysgonamonadaceae bacterium]
KVLGENVVSNEDEFKTKIEELLNNQFKPASNNLFMKEARELFLKKMESVEFPVTFLKRWLINSNDKYKDNEESLETDFPNILDDLKFHISKEQLAEKNDLKVEVSDVEALAAEVAKSQFAQYGMTNLPADVLQNYVQSLLGKEETVRNLYERALEDKVGEWLKQNITINEIEIMSKDFNKLLDESAHDHENDNEHEHEIEN